MPTDAFFQVYALDMGRQMYGDCLLIGVGDIKILVDGGHPSDFRGQPGYQSIPEQLTALLGPPPFDIDLLIVTHCHLDHIGCLPDLIRSNVVIPKWALVADHGLGFGRPTSASPLPSDSLPIDARRIVAALREEDRSAMNDADLADFLIDAEKLEDRYTGMLAHLAHLGDRLVRFGRDSHAALEQEFAETGFKILGPTRDHLLICAEAIQRANGAASGAIDFIPLTDQQSPVDLYRSVANRTGALDLIDRPGKGAALNDQSIVFKIGVGDDIALFAGDMQFAKPEVTGLAAEMEALRAAVAAAGPYKFVKLTHHTSYNGINETFLTALGNPQFLVHTGGLNDAGHPDPGSLRLLNSRSDSISFARTDRNGLVHFTWDGGLKPSRNELNDFSRNVSDDKPSEPPSAEVIAAPPPHPPVPPTPLPEHEALETIDVLFMRLPYRNGKITIGGIPIEIDLNPGRPRSDVPPSPPAPVPPPIPQPSDRLAGGRTLPKLLFVTRKDLLAAKIGQRETEQALTIVRDGGQALFELPADNDLTGLRRELARDQYKGVVILGSYDVVPSERVDVLDPALRQRIGRELVDEPDNFIVWSDDRYGDDDNDGIAELPVSRIPDGNTAAFFIRCLTGQPAVNAGRFGIRNMERPFAEAIWEAIQGPEAIKISGPSLQSELVAAELSRSSLYFMLHGDDLDATRFWGEDEGPVEAINIGCLPDNGIGVVFAGCCWGALTVDQKASRANDGVGARSPGQSMALSFLDKGANAFVGCTGAHYSPNPGERFFSEPLHRAFWTELSATNSASLALFNARNTYLRDMPHGLSRPYHLGIERKLFKQFTCLGLGW